MLTFTLLLVLAACGGSQTSTSQPADGGAAPSPAPAPSDSSSSEQAAEAFYKGKSLEKLVPFGAGGGSDVTARFIAPFYNKYIEGNPSIQVVNVPGGGSVIGANEFVNLREPNGEFALWTSGSTVYPYLLREPAVQYDLSKLQPVFAIPAGGVVYISPDTGYQEPKDILNLNENLVYAGISATGLDLVTLLSFEVLGVDIQAVMGYEGRGPARVAYEQGESNIDYQTTSAYLNSVVPLVEEGKAIPLFSFGLLDGQGNIVRDPAFPDIPTVVEFYEEVHGTAPSGTAWNALKAFMATGYGVQKVLWMHEDAPAEAVEALREASAKIAADADFLTQGEEALGGYEPYVGEELVAIVKEAYDINPADIDWVLQFLDEKYDVSF
jgi:tripartite-type tricarboxylate transporter receptor subunit TctC